MKPSWKKIYPPYLKDGTPINKAIEVINGIASAAGCGLTFVAMTPPCPEILKFSHAHDSLSYGCVMMTPEEAELEMEVGTEQENAAVFDKRTAKGFKLNLVTGKYHK